MSNTNSNKYSVPENEGFQPGSNDNVLKNYLAITDSRTIEQIEAQELERTELEIFKLFDSSYQFFAKDIHELWLGDIYSFAGKYRTVNMEKAGFMFASANRIGALMQEFEEAILQKYTPCNFESTSELALALAAVHVEFILIHPFRESNGRVARMLTDLMSAQANRPTLQYQLIDPAHDDGFERYIRAIHSGLDREYEPMQRVFIDLLEASKAI